MRKSLIFAALIVLLGLAGCGALQREAAEEKRKAAAVIQQVAQTKEHLAQEEKDVSRKVAPYLRANARLKVRIRIANQTLARYARERSNAKRLAWRSAYGAARTLTYISTYEKTFPTKGISPGWYVVRSKASGTLTSARMRTDREYVLSSSSSAAYRIGQAPSSAPPIAVVSEETEDDYTYDYEEDYGYTGDLDCADIGYAVDTTGGDPHNLDADGDGIGCESYGSGYSDSYDYDDNGDGSTTNWCGATRDGDGDGLWCEGR